ncbi:uncharacterized protein LOC136034295 [Artemia franciscana]|uniref:uncharacterized protein LOC136034295 n=1 Tax=Artemia franciscana TaxID=6661 RepID=UPI0032DB6C1C
MKLLLKFGARVNSRDKNEKTALHYACSKKCLEAVETLLEFGSDINIISQNRFTAFPKGVDWLLPSVISNNRRYHRFIIHHIVKMKAANLYVCEENQPDLQYLREPADESDFQFKCVRELDSMRRKKTPDSNTSFYELLVKGESSFAKILRNKNVMEFLKTTNNETEFPLYASILRSHFRKGRERNDLFEPANRSFNYIFKNLTELPYLCIEKIFSHLSDEDLENLKDVLEPRLIS